MVEELANELQWRPHGGSFIRKMLLLLLPLTIVPVLVMSGGAFLRARNLLRNQVADQLEAVLHAESNVFDAWVQRKEIRLGLAVHRPGVRTAINTLTGPAFATDEERNIARLELLQTLKWFTELDSIRTFKHFMVVANSGEVLASSNPAWETMTLSEPYQADFRGQTRSKAVFSPSSLYESELVVLTSAPVFNRDGLLIATVIGINESPDILRVLERVPLAHNAARGYFLSADGDIVGVDPLESALVALLPSDEQLSLLPPLRSDYVHRGFGSIEHAVLDFESFGGEPVTASFTWLPSLDIGLIIEVPQAVTFRQLNSLTFFTVLLLSGTVLVIGLAIWVGARQLAQPLVEMTANIQAFAEGDWDKRNRLQRNDEIGQLAYSFDQMADQLADLYRSLGDRVEERSAQIRTAAEVAQIATSATELNELLRRTVNLIVERFGHYHASVFILDDANQYAVLQESTGGVGETLLSQGYRLEVGSQSIIGWVTANNRPRLASEVSEDPYHLRNELLPETRSELAIPISIGDQVLGALDVQSRNIDSFDPESIAALQTLANQIASAIQKVRLLQTAELDLRELHMLYRVGRDITSAETDDRVYAAVVSALQRSSHENIFYQSEAGGFRLRFSSASGQADQASVPDWIAGAPESVLPDYPLDTQLVIVGTTSPAHFSGELREVTSRLGWGSVAYLPIYVAGQLIGLIVLGTAEKGRFSFALLQPYAGLVEMASIALEKIHVRLAIQKRLAELQSLSSVSQIISTETDLGNLYELIYSQIRGIMGDIAFQIVLYDPQSDQIDIPLTLEGEKRLELEPMRLGPGALADVIRTRQPRMLNGDAGEEIRVHSEWRGEAPARSWLGVPLIVADEIVGVMALKDVDRPKRFNEDDVRLLSTLAAQIAIVIRNARLLEEAQQRTLQLELASEISRDVSRSQNIDELVQKAIELIRDRFGYYHASVYFMDSSGQFAVIQQGTGEIGQQLRDAGYQLKVGSQSVIGLTIAQKKTVVVHDLGKDERFAVNPLLPETQGELGIPLMVGDHVLGALNVQCKYHHTFSADNVRILQILADQLSVAIVNARLLLETRDNLAKHRLLHEVTSAAAASATVDEALQAGANGLKATMTADMVSVFLYDRETETLELKVTSGSPLHESPIGRIHADQGLTGWVAVHRAPLRVDDVRLDPRRAESEQGCVALIAMPMLYRGELLGVIRIESDRAGNYRDSDLEILGTMSGTLAAIIANTRLIERQRLLFEVTSKIRRSVSVQNIMETTVKELGVALGVNRAKIQLGGEPHPVQENGEPEEVQIEDGEVER